MARKLSREVIAEALADLIDGLAPAEALAVLDVLDTETDRFRIELLRAMRTGTPARLDVQPLATRCVMCGRAAPADGRRACEYCLLRKRHRYHGRRARGQCVQCGAVLHAGSGGHVPARCARCVRLRTGPRPRSLRLPF